jgi:hypothetical protein
MPRLFRVIAFLALVLALSGSLAWSQTIRIIPIPPHVKPQWTPVPGAPQVYYAPNIPTDVFKHQGRYYFYWEGSLFQGPKPTGPWKAVTEVPAFFSQIGPEYFKTLKKEKPAPAPEAVTPRESAPTPEAAPAPPTKETPPAAEAAPPGQKPEEAPPAAGEEPPAPKVM